MTDLNGWIEQTSSSFWKPEQIGDSIEGELTKIEDGTYGTNYTLKQADGTNIIPGAYKALISRMANANIGDMVKIVYDGQEAPKMKGYKPTKLFKVFVKKSGIEAHV